MTFLVISLVLFGINSDRTWAEDDRHRLLSPSALKMFVDELPDMPRISAFHVLDGVSLPKSLKIGMFHKKWVSLTNSPTLALLVDYSFLLDYHNLIELIAYNRKLNLFLLSKLLP